MIGVFQYSTALGWASLIIYILCFFIWLVVWSEIPPGTCHQRSILLR
ncbi:hypothetical protein X975_05868, partial [Stegodyphus mimosarum]